MICIHCGHTLQKGFFCDSCGALQPFASGVLNYFELFGGAQTFAIDEKDLEKAYFEAQKKFHPDRFITKPDEHAYALDYSALLNEAYEILKKPLLRARYLLKIEGHNGDSHHHFNEATILEELFVLQEELMSIEDLQTLASFEQNILSLKDEEYRVLEGSFARKDYVRAHASITKIAYFEKIVREIKMLKNRLEDM